MFDRNSRTDAGTSDWRVLGICAQMRDIDKFHPGDTRGQSRKIIVERAIAICKWCQVQRECLLYALKERQESGIWGGEDMSRLGGEEQRRIMQNLRLKNK
ncbi:WhiB family transcriptional regulator [Rhodococcus sp. BH5]|uniref:WhiB family transcriptional regulator n=1 Tax=Rhodococcus sp. BH5 TaxID=2871702 RepID=UPI003FA7193A